MPPESVPAHDIISPNGDPMNKHTLALLLILAGLAAVLFVPALAAQARSADPQVSYATPTAGPDGRILYEVQPGDNCTSISLRMGISIEDIVLLNGMRGGECAPIAGTMLIVGTAAPTITPSGPTPTPTDVIQGTPFAGTGEVCIRLYNDVDGNAMAEDGEESIPGGAVSLTDRTGKVSKTGSTGPAPTCFTELPEGDYSISLAVPEGYNPTTRTTYELRVRAGDQSLLEFGAQLSSSAEPLPVSEGGRSPLLGILGAGVLLLGIALGVYARFVFRR